MTIIPKPRLTTLMLAFAFAPCAGATIFSVDTPVDLPDGDIFDGICSWMADPNPNVATCSLRAAVMQANATPVDPQSPVVAIHLLAGETYFLAIPPTDNDVLGSNGDLDIFRPMAIGAATVFEPERAGIVIDESVERAFELKAGASGSSIFGLRMRRQLVEEDNGGYACVLAAEKDAGQLTLDRIEVYDTPCFAQGTMVFRKGVNALIRDSEFHNGDRAMLISGANITLERTSIHSNDNGTQGVTTVAVNSGSIVTINQSTFVDNPIHIGAFDASLTIVSSTLSDVTGDTGLLWFKAQSDASTLRIQNSLLASSGAPICYLQEAGTLAVTGSVLGDHSCATDTAPMAPNLYDADVQLTPIGNFGGPTPTMELLPTSDGIDWIPPQFCNPNGTDQRGYPRAIDYSGLQPAHCDAGATELQVVPPPPEGHIFGDGFEGD